MVTEAEDRLERMREGNVSRTERRRETRAGERENMGEQGQMERDEKEGEESEVPVEHRTCR